MGRSLDRKNVLRDTSFFSGSTYIAQTMFFIRGFLNAKILGPTLYGLWSALNIILKYSTFAHIGTFNALAREIPYENGRGSTTAMDKLKDVTFTFSIMTISLFSAILTTVAVFLYRRLSTNEFVGFIAIALLAIVMTVYEFRQTSLIAIKRFVLISKAKVIFPVLSVILTLILVPTLKIYGVYIVAFTIPFLTILYLYIKEPCKLRLVFDLKEVIKLVRIGFPIMSIDFLQGTIVSIAGILVLSFLGKTDMGYYSVAMLAGNFLIYFPISLHRTFEPHIYQRYGETHDISELKKYLTKPTLVMTLLFPVLLAFYYIGVKFFVLHFLSNYAVSLYPFFIILIARFFLAFSPTAVAFITGVNKQKFLVPVYLVGISIVFLLSMVFINKGLGIMAAAIGLLVSFFFIGSVIFIYAINHYVKNTFKCLGYLFCACLPLLYMVSAVLLIDFIVPSVQGLLPDGLRLVIKSAMLCISSLPLVFIAHRTTGILSDALNFLKAKR